MSVHVTFFGAAETVTGSCYHVIHPHGRFLVDCGMFQGTKTLRQFNYGSFPFDPETVDFVLLTHAHIDHSGLIPKLYRHGFQGPVYASASTRDLLTYMLPDSGHIQENEVKRINRRNQRRGLDPVEPIYTRDDAESSLEKLRCVPFAEWTDAGKGVRARLWNAGHILGSASIEVEVANAGVDGRPLRMLFSGDIGPDEKALQSEPDAPRDLDYLMVESTYGDRDRSDLSPEARRGALKAEVQAALKANGKVLVPAFAVERTQELIYDLGILMETGDIPPTRIFLDSPLAIRATEVFETHQGDLPELAGVRNPFRHPMVRFVESAEESIRLNQIKSGAIILAASGMCDAGRIRHHLKHGLSNPANTVLFVGYQAPGALGHLISEGADRVRIHGEEIAVRARVRTIDFYSAHADRQELVEWVRDRLPVRQGIFLTHGEKSVIESFRSRLVKSKIEPALIHAPRLDETFDFVASGPVESRLVAPRLAPEELEKIGVQDWHNDYAAFLLEIANDLRRMPSSDARRQLLGKMRRLVRREAKAAAG